MFELKKTGYDENLIISYGNMFLIGNGHLGYRGTLEEYRKSEMVGLNVAGFYDRYKDKWREPINSPNPFYVSITLNENKLHARDSIYHEQVLDLKNAIFKRKTEFNDLIIESERFVLDLDKNSLAMKYKVIAKNNITFNVFSAIDTDIYEINGPHFKRKEIGNENNIIYFNGTTNEDKLFSISTLSNLNGNLSFKENESLYGTEKEVSLSKDEVFSFEVFAKISENSFYLHNDGQVLLNYIKNGYEFEKEIHSRYFSNKWDMADVLIDGDPEAQFNLRYSIYHLLILENECYSHSIPARGISGETYKGAIFWDTEIFLLPFYLKTNYKMARNIIEYRINTLNGAILKAKEYGYDGAFYAWESQDTGIEACSKYNVTDAVTGEPVRTYFNEKQIHLNMDILYALQKYIDATLDYSILKDGALKMAIECSLFFISYSKLINGQYHINDVIGPDEYHERINDNAFTNYMAYYGINYTKSLLGEYSDIDTGYDNKELINTFNNYLNNLYLPKINSDNLIEQFSGYHNLEDVSVKEVLSRVKHPNEYLGTENGVAFKTKMIKQADVITLLSLNPEKFSKNVIKANYDYYSKYTEHGSTLSSSMYSLSGSRVGYIDEAYKMFMKTSSVDLGLNQKMWAGGIYIGGTHPAANGGAYLSVINGFSGLNTNDGKITFDPSFKEEIKRIEFKFYYRDKKYKAIVYHNGYELEEIK